MIGSMNLINTSAQSKNEKSNFQHKSKQLILEIQGGSNNRFRYFVFIKNLKNWFWIIMTSPNKTFWILQKTG